MYNFPPEMIKSLYFFYLELNSESIKGIAKGVLIYEPYIMRVPLHSVLLSFLFVKSGFNRDSNLLSRARNQLNIVQRGDQVSMENAVKLFTRMRRLSPLSWFVVEHCYVEEGHYRLAKFSAYWLSFLRPHERVFKR